MDCMIKRPRIERRSSSADPGPIKVATRRPSGWSERTDSGLCDGWGSLWSKANRRLTQEARPLGLWSCGGVPNSAISPSGEHGRADSSPSSSARLSAAVSRPNSSPLVSGEALSAIDAE